MDTRGAGRDARAALIVALVALVSAIPCAADDTVEGSSKNFFEHNYAESPLRPDARKSELTPSHAGDDAAPPPQAAPTDKPVAEASTPPVRELAGGMYEVARKLKVKSLGLILNFADIPHGQAKLAETYAVAEQYNLPLGRFYVLLDAKNFMATNDEMVAMVVRGISVKFTDHVPKQYPVKLSPTWLVQTEAGEFVLEAPPSLAKFFNANGEFLDPRIEKTSSANDAPDSEDDEASAPAPKAEESADKS